MKRRDDFVMRNVGGENMLVPIGSKVMDLNGIVILNDVATYIWEFLSADVTMEELVLAVVSRFDIDKETAKADIQTFINKSSMIGFLEF